jgi:hypothetical protein
MIEIKKCSAPVQWAKCLRREKYLTEDRKFQRYKTKYIVGEISGSHGGEYENVCLPGCCSV